MREECLHDDDTDVDNQNIQEHGDDGNDDDGDYDNDDDGNDDDGNDDDGNDDNDDDNEVHLCIRTSIRSNPIFSQTSLASPFESNRL